MAPHTGSTEVVMKKANFDLGKIRCCAQSLYRTNESRGNVVSHARLSHTERVWYFTVCSFVLLSQLPQAAVGGVEYIHSARFA